MPRRADLPPGWRHFSKADKIKHLLGMSLDRALEIVSWPLAECDPPRLSLQVQVLRVVVKIAGKALLDGSLGREAAWERDRERVLAEMMRQEFGRGDRA